MNAFCSQQLNHVLAKPAQSNARQSQVRACGSHAKNVALHRVGLHPQQQVRRGKMEEAQCMRLHHLRQVQHPPHLRHLIEWPALAKLLKTAHLRHVELRIFHLTFVVEVDRDLAVPFKARNRIDSDRLAHGANSESSSSKTGKRRYM